MGGVEARVRDVLIADRGVVAPAVNEDEDVIRPPYAAVAAARRAG